MIFFLLGIRFGSSTYSISGCFLRYLTGESGLSGGILIVSLTMRCLGSSSISGTSSKLSRTFIILVVGVQHRVWQYYSSSSNLLHSSLNLYLSSASESSRILNLASIS